MNTTTQNILDVFQTYRMAPTPLDQYDQVGKPILAQKIEDFVVKGDTLKFVMLGFPFKSANTRDKVIGQMPDLAEQVTLENFAQFNADIKQVYQPGVNISIASDGFIFNDLLNIEDYTVEMYREGSADMGRTAKAPMSWYSLNDFYKGSLSLNRERVVEQFPLTDVELEREILMNPDTNFLYRGMTIFMMEELAMQSFPSKNQHQKAAKKLVRQMMIRNEAWSSLVRTEFSEHIRLSMHPSINNGSKYSFKLIKGNHTQYSAWHAAIWKTDSENITIHRKDAEAQNLTLVYKDGRPFNYV